MNNKSYCLVVLVSVVATAGYCGESESVTLETVHALVARNEVLLNPIKMAYTVKKSRTGKRQVPAVGKRRPGRRHSHINCVWAQAGEKHYVREDFFYGPNEPARSTERIFEPQRVTKGKLPDLMEGSIYPRDSHDWYSVLVAKLGLRPFEGHYTLSQILVPEHASVHREIETIDGREMYVVDAKRPVDPPYFARIWIDRQRGMPRRIRYFGRHPNWGDAKSMSQINDIKLHQLPNGGWIPIEGVRSIDWQDGSISYEHMTVNVNSITTRREHIPESLFKIDFPDGAGIYNVISGLTTVEGQPLKTYEQVVSTGGSYIAGVVADEKGTPVSGVVVGPCAVRTRQSNGRFHSKLIQGHERPCAITDMKGCFAIELEEEGSYDFWVFPEDFVDMRVRDVPLGKHDLKITLRKGGIVTGRIVRLMTGRKIPVANVEVTAKSEGRGSNDIRFSRTRAKTDSEGRFQIKYLETLMPKRRTNDSEQPQYVPRAWQIRCGSASETVLFEDGKNARDVELVLKPDLRRAVPLIGRALPGFEAIKIDLAANRTKDEMMLLCFFDMQQRPSRHYVIRLAKQVKALKQKGVSLVAVQAVKVDENVLSKWATESNIPFPIGIIQENEENVRFNWAVCSLPWLILADRNHIVTAEGFGMSELEQKIQMTTGRQENP
jgi:hypothetical protein